MDKEYINMNNEVAILISGHFRRFDEIASNFHNKFINKISNTSNYKIFIHTWNTNFTHNKNQNNDKSYDNITITQELITHIFSIYNIPIESIIIEDQDEIKKKLDLHTYLLNTDQKSIHGKFNDVYVRDILNQLFWQYYGHHKVLSIVDDLTKFDFVIKTRFDMLYEDFDMSLLNSDMFFTKSHLKNGTSINSAFFGGKSDIMVNVLSFFTKIIYNNGELNLNMINRYHSTDINLNCIFRYYVFNILNILPVFVCYNPKIYRTKHNVLTIR
tara:strand:- start:1259 stop:2071 length:813 start_codon:yes stop_codon:yes gene_type:complete